MYSSMTPLSSDTSPSSRPGFSTSGEQHMATATSSIPTGTVGSQQQKRPASYIKVIDLAQSYNIDAEKVKVEIQKLNSAKREAEMGKTSLDGKEDSHSMVSKVTDDSECSAEKRQHGGGAAKGYPKRFSAMNGGFNLCLLVGKVEVVVDKLRVDKSRVRLAEVQVGDETGSISLRARDSQIDELEKVSKEGGAIVLRNSSIELFQGKHLRLAVTKWGKITVYPDDIASTPRPPTSINTDLDLSIVDLNLVPPDIWLQPPSSPSAKSADSSPKQNMTSKQNPSAQQTHHHPYRKKGRGHHHDRRYQPQQPYMARVTKSHPGTAQDQNYNPMLGMNQNMMGFSPIYPGTQYYPNYGDAQMQTTHQTQQLDQQKHHTAQQLLLMQQHNFQLQQQMEQMEQLLYSRGQTIDHPTQSQTSRNFTGNQSLNAVTNLPPQAGEILEAPRISPVQNLLQQTHMGSQAPLGGVMQNERRNSINPDSSMAIEVPMSPQMNPNAVSFAPHYSIPDLGSGLHHSQQQYFLQPPQGANFHSYNNPSVYAHSMNQVRHQERDKQNDERQGNNI